MTSASEDDTLEMFPPARQRGAQLVRTQQNFPSDMGILEVIGTILLLTPLAVLFLLTVIGTVWGLLSMAFGTATGP